MRVPNKNRLALAARVALSLIQSPEKTDFRISRELGFKKSQRRLVIALLGYLRGLEGLELIELIKKGEIYNARKNHFRGL